MARPWWITALFAVGMALAAACSGDDTATGPGQTPSTSATSTIVERTSDSTTTSPPEQPPPSPAVTLRIGTDDFSGRPAADQIVQFSQQVADLSAGRITIEPVWQAGGTEGYRPDWDQEVAQLAISGELELALVPSRAWDRLGVDTLRPLTAPFLVDSQKLLAAVLTSDLADQMLAGLEPTGVIGLAIFPDGLRHPFAFEQPMLGPDDYVGATIRTPTSETAAAMFAAWGATVDDLPPDRAHHDALDSDFVLQAGAVATSNVTLYPKANVLVANADVLAELPAGDRELLEQAAIVTLDWAIDSLPAEQVVAEAFCAAGGVIVHADDGELDALRQAVGPILDDIRSADASNASAVDTIESMRADLPAPVPAPECGEPAATDATGDEGLLTGVYRTEITPELMLAAWPDTPQSQLDNNVGGVDDLAQRRTPPRPRRRRLRPNHRRWHLPRRRQPHQLHLGRQHHTRDPRVATRYRRQPRLHARQRPRPVQVRLPRHLDAPSGSGPLGRVTSRTSPLHGRQQGPTPDAPDAPATGTCTRRSPIEAAGPTPSGATPRPSPASTPRRISTRTHQRHPLRLTTGARALARRLRCRRRRESTQQAARRQHLEAIDGGKVAIPGTQHIRLRRSEQRDQIVIVRIARHRRHVRWIGEAMRQDADVGDESIELLPRSPSQEPLASQHALQLVVQLRTRHHPDVTRSDELDDAPWSTLRDRSGHQNVRIDHDPERLSHGRPSAAVGSERCQFLGRDQLGLTLRQGIRRRCVLTSELVEQPAQVGPDDEPLHRLRNDHIDRHAATLSLTPRRRQQLVADLYGRHDDRVLPHSDVSTTPSRRARDGPTHFARRSHRWRSQHRLRFGSTRAENGRTGRRKGGKHRSTTVTHGQQWTLKPALTRGETLRPGWGKIRARGFDSPQLHEKCHLPGEMQGVDGMLVPPSNTLVGQAIRRRAAALTRHSSRYQYLTSTGRSSPRTEFGRMTTSNRPETPPRPSRSA
jgi:TRAP-type C4-dicarboxylate transport system substrate-binding protein